ncbi:hypothetical protein N2152v2_006611 [Parachlorella kessleri]
MTLGAQSAVGGLIFFGTVTSLAAKYVYELDSEGRSGQHKLFEKPWAMTTVMFLGMTFCLPLAYLAEYRSKQRSVAGTADAAAADSVTEPLLGGTASGTAAAGGYPTSETYLGSEARTIAKGGTDGTDEGGKKAGLGASALAELRQSAMLAIPTAFDLIATVLMNVGLLSVTASVYQMMRGAEMLFAALFTVVFLKRSLNRFHLMGIGCCVLGITLVGAASLLSGEGSSTHEVSQSQMLLGMFLIIASQAVQAAQITFEDFFMADLAIPPLKIVGYEGLFGALGMLCVMLPIVQHLPGDDGKGIHEDSLDTWHMITHSRVILTVLLCDMFALLMYNVSGMCVTGHLGAVFRTVLETTRTLFVWLVGLLMFYTPLGFGKLGESWSVYSWIQAAGFVVLVSGTLVYSKGDEKAVRQELEEELIAEGEAPALAQQHAAAVAAALAGGAGSGSLPMSMPGSASAVHAGSGSLPMSMPGSASAVPITVAASSLKSSMNISAFSLPGSFSQSLNRRRLLG